MLPLPPSSEKTSPTPEWQEEARKHRKRLRQLLKAGLDKPDAVNEYFTTLIGAYPTGLSFVTEPERQANLESRHKGHKIIFDHLKANPQSIPDCSLNIFAELGEHPSQILVELLLLIAEKKPSALSRDSLKLALTKPELQNYVPIILHANPKLMQADEKGNPAKSLASSLFKAIAKATDNVARETFRRGGLAAIREFAPEAITTQSVIDYIEALKDRFGFNPKPDGMPAAPDYNSDELKKCLHIANEDVLPRRADLLIVWKENAPHVWATIASARISMSEPTGRDGLSPRFRQGAVTSPHIHGAQRLKRSCLE